MDPAAISSGIGQGEAQVFKPVEDFLGEAMKAAETKKKETAANRARAMEQLAKMGEFHIWTQRDGDAFAKKQNDVWKEVQTKDINDPQTMMWINQKMQELTYLADLSNTDKDLYTKSVNLYATKPTKYFSDTVDKLQQFADPKNALSSSTKYNPLWMSERPDFDADLAKMQTSASQWVERNKQEGAKVGTLPGGGSTQFKIETTTGEYPMDKAMQDVRVYISEPNNYRAVEERYNADPNKANYKDVYDYADKVIAPKIAMKSIDVDTAQLSGGAGAGANVTPNKWFVEERKQEAPKFDIQQIENIATGLEKDPAVLKDYKIKSEIKAAKELLAKGKSKAEIISNLVDRGLSDNEAENRATTAIKNPEITPEENMTLHEYAVDLTKKTPTAKEPSEGFTFDFGKASSGSAEARDISKLQLVTAKGIEISPNTVIVKKGSEPIITGLGKDGKPIDVPYSEIHAKLKGETSGDWDILKKQMIERMGYDPFSKWESVKAKTGGAQSAAKSSALTPEEWNKQWASLPKGKSMIGLDGKTYTKK